MKSTINIFKAISDKLRELYPASDIYDKGTEEGYGPNCFYIEAVNPQVNPMGQDMVEEFLTIRISYFPADIKDFKSLLQVKETLQQAFLFSVAINDDFVIPIESREYEITSNNVLECLMTMRILQYLPEAEGENITTLENNMEVK